MQEEWRQVDGYDNYEVSNHGRVRNKYNGSILAQTTIRVGYKSVHLSQNGNKKNKLVHRLVAQSFIENSDNLPMVDHINHDVANNCVTNLRWCDHSRNNANSMQKRNTSGYKGVFWHRKAQKWVSEIMKNGKRTYLGCFEIALEAAKAYNDAALKHFGEFALLNDLTPKPKIKVSIKPKISNTISDT